MAAKAVFLWAVQAVLFHRARSLLTVGAIGMASALLMSTLGFNRGYERALKHNIDSMGYQILVTGKGCPHEAATLILRGGTIPMYVTQRVADRIAAQPEVQDTTLFLIQAVPGTDGKSTTVFTGIDEKFLKLKPSVTFQRGGWFSSSDAQEAVIGYNVADYRRLKLGDEIEVRGYKLRICGVLDNMGSQDDGMVFIPLALSQTIFDKPERVTAVGIRLKDMRQAGPFIERLYELPSVQVVRMAQVQNTIMTILKGIQALLTGFGWLCLLVALTGVFNVSLIAVFERKAEMGVLRAMGCSRARLFVLVWSETLLLGLAGALLGTALAVAMKDGVELALRAMLAYVPRGDVVALTPGTFLAGWGIVVPLCLLAGGYPAWRSAQTPPLESIRGAA